MKNPIKHAKSAPEILSSPAQMRDWRDRQAGRVGFVPTMGALHAGHGELLSRLRDACDHLVLSIFVNPTQFGPQEDLAKYPRTFAADLELAQTHGVDAIYFPASEQVYPPGYSTYVQEYSLTGPLCGEFRPGHFRGVTTVVLKLFNLVQPHTAYFGLKDAQQFFVLHKMARDLDLRVSVEGICTVRETDGLAMSSRNRYLSVAERALAPAIYTELRNIAAAISSAGTGERTRADEFITASKAQLTHLGFQVQYLECLRLPDFSSATSPAMAPHEALDSPYLVAVAAYLGKTRLIDNIIVHPNRLADFGIRVHF